MTDFGNLFGHLLVKALRPLDRLTLNNFPARMMKFAAKALVDPQIWG